MHQHIRIDRHHLDRLLQARGWTRRRLLAAPGIDARELDLAEASGTAPLALACALADALDVSPSVLDRASAPARRWRERRTAWIVGGALLLFLMTAGFGYRVGADLAARDNRADCVAAGGVECDARR